MEFYQVLKMRRSVRHYDPGQTISDEVLFRILEAGRIAPSAANRQPWKFIVVKDPKMRERICQCYKGEWLKNAPVILIVVGRRDKSWVRVKDGHNSLEVDLTIALDHMILAAAAEGVGSCWIMAFDYEILSSVLNLKENEFVSCLTPLGYPLDKHPDDRIPDRNKLEDIIEII
jgi:nitroreductase